MLKILPWAMVPPLVTLSMQAFAIILDCKENRDGTYTCVEIEASAEPTAVPPKPAEAARADSPHLEQARKNCRYREPRRRTGGMSSVAAVRMERKKTAQEEYDRCVADQLRQLENAPE